MTEDIEVLDLHFPPISDAELDACVASLPEPTAASQANYQRNWDYMLQINADAGVFQNVEAECAPEEARLPTVASTWKPTSLGGMDEMRLVIQQKSDTLVTN